MRICPVSLRPSSTTGGGLVLGRRREIPAMGRLRHAGSSSRPCAGFGPGRPAVDGECRRVRYGGFAPESVDILVRREGELQLPVGDRRLQRGLGSRQPRARDLPADRGRRLGRRHDAAVVDAGRALGRQLHVHQARHVPYHAGVDPDKFKGTVVVHAEATPTPTPTATPTARPPRPRRRPTAHRRARLRQPGAQLVPGPRGRRERQALA